MLTNKLKELKMDKGIRLAATTAFPAWNARRLAGEFGGNTPFRAHFIAWLVTDYGITHAAGTSHYNHARKLFAAANPTLVEGLGRPPEKNNGGRKKKLVAEVETAMLLLGYTPSAYVPAYEEFVEAQQSFQVLRSKDSSLVFETTNFEKVQQLMQQKSPRHNGKFTGAIYWK